MDIFCTPCCQMIVSALCVCVCVSSSRVRQAQRRHSPTCSTCPTDRVLSTRPLPPPPPPPLPQLSAWGSWSAVSVRHSSPKLNMPSNTQNKILWHLLLQCDSECALKCEVKLKNLGNCSFLWTGGNSVSVRDYFQQQISTYLVLEWVFTVAGWCMWDLLQIHYSMSCLDNTGAQD